MEPEFNKARSLLLEFRWDYGKVPAWKTEKVLEMLGRGKSVEYIEVAYRETAMMLQRKLQEDAYEKLVSLRKEYGRCRLVNEWTVRAWIEANVPYEAMRAEYWKRVVRAVHWERALRINERMLRDAGGYSFHDIDMVLDALEVFGHESDNQIINHVDDVVFSGFAKGLFGPDES